VQYVNRSVTLLTRPRSTGATSHAVTMPFMNPSDSWTTSQPQFSRVSAAEAVLADLRASIERGELPVGQRLPSEAALGKRYQVSRAVVREALRSCETLGLTRTRTGSGTYVIADRVPTVLTVGNYSSRDLLEARPHVEIPAAGLAAGRSTEPVRIELQRLVGQMEAATDPQNWVRLDAAFHAAIARASGNLVFVDLQATMATALARQSETLNLVAHRREEANREHSAIVTAIADHSVDQAEKAMSEHLAQVRRAVEHLTTGE
jgi:GntR family transcriptional regulator, transcriptional repressor for pyruvate dehydrogenase complex